MAPTRIVNDRTFRRLWKSDLSTNAIAEHYGVSAPAITRAARRFEYLPRRFLRGLVDQPDPDLPEVPKEVSDQYSLECRLRATRGNYLLLEEIAKEHGWNSKKALNEFHKARTKI